MVSDSRHPTDAVRASSDQAGPVGDWVWVDVRSADELNDTISRAVCPVVVAFEDEDCGHCRAQRTMLSLAWQQLAWQVTTLRVDGSRLPQVADCYRVLGYPTLVVFHDGQVVDRIPGRRDARDVLDRLSRLAAPGAAPKKSKVSSGPGASSDDSNDKG